MNLGFLRVKEADWFKSLTLFDYRLVLKDTFEEDFMLCLKTAFAVLGSLHIHSSSSNSSLAKATFLLVNFFIFIFDLVLSSVEALESISFVLFKIGGEKQVVVSSLYLRTTP